MTKLFTFTTPTPLTAQLEAIQSKLSAQEKKVFESVDHILFNSDDDHQNFLPLTIEQVRSLHTEVARAPLVGKSRQVILGNLEQASLPAQQALLKILEEPPEHVQMIVTTLAVQKLLPTILSRCEIISVQNDQIHASVELPQLITTAIDQPTQKKPTLHELFLLSEELKDRGTAQEFLLEVIGYIHRHPQYPTTQMIQQLQDIMLALQQLEKNINVRLVVEHVLFGLCTPGVISA